MSNLAPKAVAVPVRRATYPSTASSTSATALIATRAATWASPKKPWTVSAATLPASTARTAVTRSAGPR